VPPAVGGKKQAGAFDTFRMSHKKQKSGPATLPDRLFIYPDAAVLWQPVEIHFRPAVPASFSIPQFHALNYPAISREIDGPCASPTGDLLTDGQIFLRTIAKMHNDALEVDGPAAHTKLNGAKLSVRAAYPDVVVILAAIDVRVSEVRPSPSVSIVSVSVAVALRIE
jgi:hypothetical protein